MNRKRRRSCRFRRVVECLILIVVGLLHRIRLDCCLNDDADGGGGGGDRCGDRCGCYHDDDDAVNDRQCVGVWFAIIIYRELMKLMARLWAPTAAIECSLHLIYTYNMQCLPLLFSHSFPIRCRLFIQ